MAPLIFGRLDYYNVLSCLVLGRRTVSIVGDVIMRSEFLRERRKVHPWVTTSFHPVAVGRTRKVGPLRDGEKVKIVRDSFVVTNRRILVYDSQWALVAEEAFEWPDDTTHGGHYRSAPRAILQGQWQPLRTPSTAMTLMTSFSTNTMMAVVTFKQLGAKYYSSAARRAACYWLDILASIAGNGAWDGVCYIDITFV